MNFADRWNAAGSDGADVPDGNYDVSVLDASAFNRRSDGAEFAKLVLEVERGEHARRTFDHFMNLNNAVGLAIARDALAMYGFDTGDPTGNVDSWTAFQLAIGKLVGVKANVSLGTRGGFREVKVNSAQMPLTQQHETPPAQAASAAAVDDGDIPF